MGDYNIKIEKILSYCVNVLELSPGKSLEKLKDMIYNENKIEGIDFEKEEISNIIDDIFIEKKVTKNIEKKITNLVIRKEEDYYNNMNSKYIDKNNDFKRVVGYLKTLEKATDYKLDSIKKATEDFFETFVSYGVFSKNISIYKQNENYIDSSNVSTAHPFQVRKRLEDLDGKWLEIKSNIEDKTDEQYLKDVLEIEYEYLKIHPHYDYNGRIGRIILNKMLQEKKLPPVIIKENEKENYLKALNLKNIGKDEPLYEFYEEKINETKRILEEDKDIEL